LVFLIQAGRLYVPVVSRILVTIYINTPKTKFTDKGKVRTAQ